MKVTLDPPTAEGRRRVLSRAVERVRSEGASGLRVALVTPGAPDWTPEGMIVDVSLPLGVLFPEDPPTEDPDEPGGAPGRLLVGRMGDVRTAVIQGPIRPPQARGEAPLIRVVRLLGAEVLIIIGECCSLHHDWRPGEGVLVVDHLNLLGTNPLVGENLDDFGPRFPDMSVAYDPELGREADRLAAAQGRTLHRGVYAAVSGGLPPSPAEREGLRRLGADVVGGAVVPGVITARHMSMTVVALALITDAPPSPLAGEGGAGATDTLAVPSSPARPPEARAGLFAIVRGLIEGFSRSDELP